MHRPFMPSSIGITKGGKAGQILGIMSLCSLTGSGRYGFIESHVGTPIMLQIQTGAMALVPILCPDAARAGLTRSDAAALDHPTRSMNYE